MFSLLAPHGRCLFSTAVFAAPLRIPCLPLLLRDSTRNSTSMKPQTLNPQALNPRSETLSLKLLKAGCSSKAKNGEVEARPNPPDLADGFWLSGV